MRKIYFLITLLFTLAFVKCKTYNKQAEVDKLNHYAIIQYNPNEKYPKFENAEPTNLTYEEILKLERIIMPKIIKNLKEHKYFRQYVAAKNLDGEKLVWINFFCEEYYNPSDEIYIMEGADGGNCFFQVKVNLTKEDCYFYMENMEG
jgi:hypothetical protein